MRIRKRDDMWPGEVFFPYGYAGGSIYVLMPKNRCMTVVAKGNDTTEGEVSAFAVEQKSGRRQNTTGLYDASESLLQWIFVEEVPPEPGWR